MGNMITIFKRDVRSYFSSPIAYVVIGLFLAVTGIFFYLMLTSFLQYSYAAMMQRQNVPLNVNLMMIRPFLLNTCVIVLFMIPMITMRSFSEDKKSGTMELLLTSPLTNWQIILGKFFATYFLFVVMILVTFLFMIFLFIWGKPQLMPVLIGYLGLLLMGAALVALGNFISSLTENQIVAAVLTFGMLLLFWILSWVSDLAGPSFRPLFTSLSLFEHYENFPKGILDTRDLIYYLSFAALFLFLTLRVLASKRYRG